MPNISLASYAIRVHEKYRPQESLQIRAFGDAEVDLLDELEHVLERLGAEPDTDENAQSVLRIRDLNRDGDTVSGMVLAGNYGYTAALMDVETATPTYDRRVNDAELIPMFFYFRCPEGADAGVAVLERFGGSGIKTQLNRVIETRFRENFQDYVFRLNPQLPREVLQELLEGRLQAIQLVTFRIPEDITDSVRTGAYDPRDAYLIQEIKAKRGRSLRKPQWLRDLAEGRIQISEVQNAVPEDADILKVRVDYAGRQRVVDFSRPDKLSPYVDVSQEVETEGGHPVPSSIRATAEEIANEVLERMGIEG